MFGVDDVLIGAGIGAGTDILGGQLAAAQNRQSQRFSADLQREFAQHGIQWRVEDAKRAGLHPLAALGMMPASASPMVIGDVAGEGIAKAGQSIGSAVSQSQDQKALTVANLRLLNSQSDKYDAEKASILFQLSEEKRKAMQSAPALGIRQETPGNIIPEGQVPNPPVDTGAGYIEMKPAPILSGKEQYPHIQAGQIPGLSELKLHPRLNMLMPAGEGQESTTELWNETPTWEKILLLMRNQKHYGGDWFKDWLRVKSGYEPEGSYTKGQPQPHGSTNTLVQRNGVQDAIERAIGSARNEARRYRRKFNKFKQELP